MITIRPAVATDSPALFELMHELAVYERYDHEFAINEAIVYQYGFSRTPPDFYAIVAEENEKLVGMVVYYFVPYTAIARPTLFIKELYVRETARNQNVGKTLMQAVSQQALEQNCGAIKWMVAPWNADGIRFYESLGAQENTRWLHFDLNETAFTELAHSKLLNPDNF